MARIRTVKPELFRHEALFEAEASSGLPLRLAFIGLLTAVDREGRFVWSPRTLKLDCLPYDDLDFGEVLDALQRHGFVVKYEVDGKFYGAIPSFGKHQHVNLREAQSTIPGPENGRTCMHVQAHGEGKGKEGKGREQEHHGADAPDDASNVLPFRPSAEVQSAEDEFWEIVDREAKSRRLPRAMMAQLLKLHDGDCEMALVSLKAAIEAKEPTKYLGKVLANIRGERELESAPERRDEKYPAFVRDFISEGYHVEKKANGTWRCGGSIYDSHGQVVGW